MYMVAVEIVHQPNNAGLLFSHIVYRAEDSFLRKTSGKILRRLSILIFTSLNHFISFNKPCIFYFSSFHILISLVLLDYTAKRQYTVLYFVMVVYGNFPTFSTITDGDKKFKLPRWTSRTKATTFLLCITNPGIITWSLRSVVRIVGKHRPVSGELSCFLLFYIRPLILNLWKGTSIRILEDIFRQ